MVKVAIIGAGEMGAWFADNYQRKGLEVRITDKDEQKESCIAKKFAIGKGSLGEIIADADEVLIATPRDAIKQILRDNKRILTGKVIYDIASVKNGTAGRLGAVSRNSVSLHPMWGGAASGFEYQNLVMIPTVNLDNNKYNKFFQSFKDRFEKYGLHVKVVQDEHEHDQLMAWNLAAYHFIHLVTGLAFSKSGFDVMKHLSVEGTTATLSRICTEAVVHSDPKLYADIQMHNPYVAEALRTIMDCAANVKELVLAKDIAGFASAMKAAQEYFLSGTKISGYLPNAMEQFARAAKEAKKYEFRPRTISSVI